MNTARKFLRQWFFVLILFAVGATIIGADDTERPSSYLIDGIVWIPQTWNNCGPATLAMGMDHWNVSVNQQEIANIIRPNPNDGHVSLEQIGMAAASQGMESRYIPSGNLNLVKTFVAQGYPVMMPTWHIDEEGSQMGHYRLVHGYDDGTGLFDIRDSLEPVGYRMDYRTFDMLWRVFNRRMLIVYPSNRSDEVESIAEQSGTDVAILEASLEKASREYDPPYPLPKGMSTANYRAYSDYNRAMALTALGRYTEASELTRSAFELGLPWRMLWYQSEVLESMFNVGEYEWINSTISDALAPYPYLEELWYWLGMAEKKSGNNDAANIAFRRALEIRPGWDLPTGELSDFE